MTHEFIGVDTNADGKIDDLRPGAVEPAALDLDKRQLEVFANSFLKLNWFNAGGHCQRALTFYVDHYAKSGRPNAVKLDFHESAAQDGDSDGVLESFTNTDVDRNGVADKADRELIRSLCTAFLALAWYEQ
ncbi:hypothetical protein [Pseudomonas fluorescens]|uniref:hypothetical protein n=1 Tax=Pseudomonas fluorescens TaxID=294 RepID=UPI0020CA5559|nr:hypothetical protein [Pseudomonas fluorescens]